MQLTSKFILITIALAYGAAVSAAPVTTSDFSVAARSTEYEDMELFVREPSIKGNRRPDNQLVSPEFATLKKFVN
jgi:hypothetical protein